jgi:hypothetical protein
MPIEEHLTSWLEVNHLGVIYIEADESVQAVGTPQPANP